MAKNKATHKGTCQACGRLHKLPGTRLSTHGYTVNWGYFNGTCNGTGRQPLELDRSYLDMTVKLLRNHAEDLDEAEPKTVAVGPAQSHRYSGKGRNCKSLYEGGEVAFNDFDAFTKLALESKSAWRNSGWREGFDYSTVSSDDAGKLAKAYGSIEDQNAKEIMGHYAEARRVAIAHLRNCARQYRQHADMLTNLAESVHGKPLERAFGPEARGSSSAPKTTKERHRIKGETFLFHITKDGKWRIAVFHKGEQVADTRPSSTKRDAFFTASMKAEQYVNSLETA